MDININTATEFWLDDLLLPVTPGTFEIKNNNTNESTQTVDGTPVTIPRRDKAQSFTISFMVSFMMDNYTDNFFTFEDSSVKNVKDLTDYLWGLKWENPKSLKLTAIHPNGNSFNGEFILDDYSYTQDATNGSDYDFTITLTEYYPARNYEVNGQLQNSLIEHGIRNPRRLD